MFGRKQQQLTAEVLRISEIEMKIRNLIIGDMKDREFTPDYPILSQKKSQLLFVPDDMMQLQPRHELVVYGSRHGFRPLDYGYTSKKFSFVKKELGLESFPVALDLRQREDLPLFMGETHRIRGEIYAICSKHFLTLDRYKQNGVQFERRRVNINVGSQKLYRIPRKGDFGKPAFDKIYDHELGRQEMCSVECWMYIGREDYWRDQLIDGFFAFKPIPIIEEENKVWLKTYYQYSRVR